MYLRLLPSEQKQFFLDLCLHAMYSDSKITSEEKECIELYCNEMEILPRYEQEYSSTAKVLTQLVDIASKQELRIIYFEILALMHADSEFSSHEKDFIIELAKAFSITTAEQENLLKALEELLTINAKVNAIVLA